QRRDPVLVTHSGTDQVLVQCFPVPAGGTLRTRLGISAPFLLTPGTVVPEGTLSFPRFLERNFALTGDLAHEIWLQGRGKYLELPEGLVIASPGTGQLLARGALPPSSFDEQANAVRISLDALIPKAWAPEGAEDSDQAVLQTLKPVTRDAISRLMLVLDGGAGMDGAGEALAIALDQIPDGTELGLIVAGGSPGQFESLHVSSPARQADLKRFIQGHEFEGGINAAPSLVAAFDMAQEQSGGAVVWIYGVQPVTFSGTASLEQRLERSSGTTHIHALAAVPGINRLVADFAHHPALITEPRTGLLANDLARLLRKLTAGARHYELVRERMPLDDLPIDAQPASGHLARLWAGDEASTLQALPNTSSRESGVKLALRHHLVTPRTGAVVLETQAQFDQHGLKPVTVDEVPSVPEPETIALLLLSAALLSIVVLRGRVAA
ncbi:MAG: hypothetical protein GY930_14915, partial [bacterium]|nr:hypothetical protein [bacterium]